MRAPRNDISQRMFDALHTLKRMPDGIADCAIDIRTSGALFTRGLVYSRRTWDGRHAYVTWHLTEAGKGFVGKE